MKFILKLTKPEIYNNLEKTKFFTPDCVIISQLLKNALTVCLFIFIHISLYSQSIEIKSSDTPLSKILIELRDTYKVKFSFDDESLSKFRITKNNKYSSIDYALSDMLRSLPLLYEKSGDVYIIYPEPEKPKEPVKYLLSGKVLDSNSKEVLPFSNLIINGTGLTTDYEGRFSIISENDSLFNVRASYLGYYVCDTVAFASNNFDIPLTSSAIGLKEIIVEDMIVERGMQVGQFSGVIRLNNKIAGMIPGNGDNSVFNLLRLQPGILAAGESSTEMIVRGSHEGHSVVLFDGATVFGLKNFNDNISNVNPFIAKDIVVMKGGFDTRYGERVGGIVDITGVKGSTSKPELNMSIDNLTANTMASIPLFKNSSLLFAFRKTYYDLYNADDLNFLGKNLSENSNTIDISPDYKFTDFNTKFSGSFKNGDSYFISYYQGSDDFSYSVSRDFANLRRRLTLKKNEDNDQKVATAYYGRKWNNGHLTNFRSSHTFLNSGFIDNRVVEILRNGQKRTKRNDEIINEVKETKISLEHHFPKTKNHNIMMGVGIVNNNIAIMEDSLGINIVDDSRNGSVKNIHVQDEISLTSTFNLKVGLRTDFSDKIDKPAFQPRASLNYKPTKRWRLNAAWGIYNQFIAKSSILDDTGNYRYSWTICDDGAVPLIKSHHYIGGVSYSVPGFIASAEAYYKTTDGLTRFIRFKRRGIEQNFNGDGRSYGIDFFIKKNLYKHSAWVSYSLGKTEERYDYFKYTNKYEDGEYYRALHDQRHELKFATLLNFKPIYLSFNYVYGSGFADPAPFTEYNEGDNLSYSRFDIAVTYRFNIRNMYFESGVSVLNLFNNDNIKYSNFVRIPADQINSMNIRSESVPFTPLLFLNISY